MTNNLFDNISPVKATVIFVAVAFTFFFSVVTYLVYAPVIRGDSSPVEVNIESGDGLKIVAGKLYNLGLIRSESLLVLYVKVRGDEDSLKAGRYLFSRSMNIPVIVLSVVSGNSETEDTEITIPEGLNVWEIDQKLVQSGLILEGEFSSKYYQEEGYLFPDTYRLNSREDTKIDLRELREKMKSNFEKKVFGAYKSLAENDGSYLVIASILEKEAKTEEDMRLVSGIIQNRLSIGMPLEIDSAVVYGACVRESVKTNYTKNCDVTFQGPAVEIKIDSPYNTYMRKGLPLGPISNPGLKAIEAALNPKASDYLFYLSTRDGSQIIYSKTSAEHGANRRKYLGI